MTSGEIRSKIRYYEGLIDEYNREKLQLEKDLDELDRLKTKVAGLQTSAAAQPDLSGILFRNAGASDRADVQPQL